MTSKAVRIHSHGGVEVLSLDDVTKPVASDKAILVKNQIVGVNYIDTYHRTGLYKVQLPFSIGRDGAGIVEAVGENVKDFKVGDRVAYISCFGGN